jgi:hypothetical protein
MEGRAAGKGRLHARQPSGGVYSPVLLSQNMVWVPVGRTGACKGSWNIAVTDRLRTGAGL